MILAPGFVFSRGARKLAVSVGAYCSHEATRDPLSQYRRSV